MTLATLMADVGDERVDLLKLDIEGSEYEVVPELDLRALGVRVFCVELHASRPVSAAHELIERIRSQSYRLVHSQMPATFTFVATPPSPGGQP